VSSYFAGDYAVIPNGIDLARFTPSGSLWPFPNAGKQRVVFVGRFDEPRKGFAVLLEAWRHVVRQCQDVELVVVGPGNASRFKSVPGSGPITFVGPVTEAELPSLLRGCHLLVAPSIRGESFGLVLVEAMACGLPVIASAIPGYEYVITDGYDGCLCEPNNAPALAACIVQLLSDTRAANAIAAAAVKSAARYGWPRIVASIMNVYESARSACYLLRIHGK
jgi:phosphatidylinositol alpha-mannosyltransferase